MDSWFRIPRGDGAFYEGNLESNTKHQGVLELWMVNPALVECVSTDRTCLNPRFLLSEYPQELITHMKQIKLVISTMGLLRVVGSIWQNQISTGCVYGCHLLGHQNETIASSMECRPLVVFAPNYGTHIKSYKWFVSLAATERLEKRETYRKIPQL